MRYDNNISWLELCLQNAWLIPFTGSSPYNQTIRPNDKNLFQVSTLGTSSSTLQIPARILTGDVGNCRCVIYLAANQNKAWLLGNSEYVPAA